MKANDPFFLYKPQQLKAPLLISCPHSGIEFPQEEQHLFKENVTKHPQDTDWYVNQIYDFAQELGIPLLAARYSRFVVDLNRPSNDIKLYTDGRHQTSLFPTLTFSQEEIYHSHVILNDEIKKERLINIYTPYHAMIQKLLKKMHETFGYALLFEAHSIKSFVPAIQSEPFPDFIIGTNDGISCPQIIEDTLFHHLSSWQDIKVTRNHPFKGGHITRAFANPSERIWTIQLEMSQRLYLDEKNDQRIPESFTKLQQHLKIGIQKIIEQLNGSI